MLVILLWGEPPHLTLNELPFSLIRRQMHLSGQSLSIYSVSANTNDEPIQTNNNIKMILLVIMSGTHNIHMETLYYRNEKPKISL